MKLRWCKHLFWLFNSRQLNINELCLAVGAYNAKKYSIVKCTRNLEPGLKMNFDDILLPKSGVPRSYLSRNGQFHPLEGRVSTLCRVRAEMDHERDSGSKFLSVKFPRIRISSVRRLTQFIGNAVPRDCYLLSPKEHLLIQKWPRKVFELSGRSGKREIS